MTSNSVSHWRAESTATRCFTNTPFALTPWFHIIVEGGNVTLTGAVRSEVERRKAEHIARSTFGVFAVENRLQVDP